MKRFLLAVVFFLGGIVGTVLVGRSLRSFTPVPIPTPQSSEFAASSSASTAFSLSEAPSLSLRGQIATYSGRIDFQSRVATESIPLAEPLPLIQQGEHLIASPGATLTLSYQDDTTLSLGSEADVTVVQTLPSELLFFQTAGRVTYKANGTSPLTVRTGQLLTRVERGEVTIRLTSESPLVTVEGGGGRAFLTYNNAQFETRGAQIQSGEVFIFNKDTRRGTFSSQ